VEVQAVVGATALRDIAQGEQILIESETRNVSSNGTSRDEDKKTKRVGGLAKD
jgi:glutamine phosphoribosylpyrophosphate amidotransferase